MALTEAFFLPFAHGGRFCILHQPGSGSSATLGAILFVHPFAEEMNKSRRMAALQARALLDAGLAKESDLAEVAARARRNAQANPNAQVRCHGRAIVDSTGCPMTSPTPLGFGPRDLRSAYKISQNGSSSLTVAVIDAFGYPNVERDLGVYRSQFGLPSTANGMRTVQATMRVRF